MQWRAFSLLMPGVLVSSVAAGQTLVVGPTVDLGAGLLNMNIPAVASNGEDFFIVWQDGRHFLADSDYDVYGRRLDARDGSYIGDEIVVEGSAYVAEYPWVAHGGAGYLVAWERWSPGRDVWGQRVDDDGTLIGGAFAITSAPNHQTTVRVAGGEGQFLVTWTDETSPMTRDVLAARVDAATGMVLDTTPIPVGAASGAQENGAAGYANGTYLVVWQVPNMLGLDLQAATIDPLTGGHGTSFAVAPAQLVQGSPDVAGNGSELLAVWDDRSVASADPWAARISTAGALVDPDGVQIDDASHDQVGLRAVWGGESWLIAWYDADVGSLRGSLVDSDLAILQGGALFGPGTSPNLASDGRGTWLMTYTHNERIWATIVYLDRDGDTVADGRDNCPDRANEDQSDIDGDGLGDACDAPQPPDAGVPDAGPASADAAQPPAGESGGCGCHAATDGAASLAPLALLLPLLLGRKPTSSSGRAPTLRREGRRRCRS